MILMQMDVICAYLESALGQNKQPIYMKIPQGCLACQEGLVCKKLKSLYGFKQVRRLWNKTIAKFFQTIGFAPTNADACILTIHWEGKLIILGVYEDDFVFGSRSFKELEWLKDQLIKEFNMKDLGEVKTVIGWEITRDLAIGTLKIDQKGYIQDLLESEGMTFCHPTVLPVKAGSTLFLDQADDYQQAELIAYQRLIRKLMYLSCGTRSNIAFVVGQLSCHNSDPQMRHLHIAKQVLRYLKGTIMLGIVGYADSSYAGDLEDKKSITGYCFFLAGAIVT